MLPLRTWLPVGGMAEHGAMAVDGMDGSFVLAGGNDPTDLADLDSELKNAFVKGLFRPLVLADLDCALIHAYIYDPEAVVDMWPLVLADLREDMRIADLDSDLPIANLKGDVDG